MTQFHRLARKERPLAYQTEEKALADSLSKAGFPPSSPEEGKARLYLRYIPSLKLDDALADGVPEGQGEAIYWLPELYDHELDFYSPHLSGLAVWPKLLRGVGVSLYRLVYPIRPLADLISDLKAKQDSHDCPRPGEILWLGDGQQGHRFYHIIRLLMDIGFSLAVGLGLWWVLVACWLFVKAETQGPGLFRQIRITQNRRPFTCYKFRTMTVNTANTPTHLMDKAQITKLGQFLRVSKLDELPQIINLLGRSMSLVGPRPCLPSQQELIEARQKLAVYGMLGGISGLAQVRDIDMRDPERLARHDAEYLARRSLWLDLKIIFKTIGLG